MATRSRNTPTSTLKRSDKREGSSPRQARRGSVTFDTQVSAYPPDPGESLQQLELRDREERADDEEELLQVETTGKFGICRALIEKRAFRRFFRACACVNILALIFSAPLLRCPETEGPGRPEREEGCESHFILFVVISCVDFILSILYTVHTIARTEYAIYLHKCRRRKHSEPNTEESDEKLSGFSNWSKLFVLALVTFSLWSSVAIGIYRSIEASGDKTIPSQWYVLFVPRSFAIFSAMKLFVPLKLSHSAAQGLLQNIKWKQLVNVTIFYLFFIYMYSLLGVQWIGGLNERCVYQNNYLNGSVDDMQFAIPVTHCNSRRSGYDLCYANSNITCREFPDRSEPVSFNFRNRVYFGQFRFVPDALFAVYEASSWELWSFMQYTALDGASRGPSAVLFLYGSMILFLVIFVQQSIFLVVIIESFADLRSESTIGSAPKPKTKPLIVLYEQPGSSEAKLRLQAIKSQASTDFNMKLNKYYFKRIEKVFIVLVLLDAIITATKYTGMLDEHATALQVWQVAVSSLFLVEIVGLLIFHLFSTGQPKLFFKNPYYWYLMILGVGGMVAAIPHSRLYDPRYAYNALAIFQAFRLPRLLRLSVRVKQFFFKILGDGSRLLVVILITLVFLIWFAVINVQFFGYRKPSEGCERVGLGHFDNFFFAFQSMFQLVMQEGWTELMSEVMCLRPEWWIINFYFIVLHLFASLILLNFFVAVILDNLDYDEEKKKVKLEQELKNRSSGGDKVPFHLKLFKRLGGAKRVPAPKLSSASGIDVPDLTEAEVKNFYDTGETSEFPTGVCPSDHPRMAHDAQFTRRSSELSNLGLLSNNSSEFVSVDVPSHHGKYWGIQGILNYVKAFRQHSREQEATRPHDSLAGRSAYELRGIGTQLDTLLPVRSEYDDYREKYRLFDSALFCMPPDHKLRTLCRTILITQMDPPKYNPSVNRPDQLQEIVRNRVTYIARYLMGRLPYFTWLMFLITWGAIAAQLWEYHIDAVDKPNHKYLWPVDLVFILFTLTELVLKILANGFFLNPNAAIRSLWDVLDWVILIATFLVMLLYLSECGVDTPQTVSLTNINQWIRLPLCLRALRPLRVLSLVPSMRRVIGDVVLGWRKFSLGILLLFLFLFMFASLGVQLFAGGHDDSSTPPGVCNGPQGFCNDPQVSTVNDCVGEFYINLKISRELLPVGNDTAMLLVPRVWYCVRRDFPFDSMPEALLTLFEVLTLEGWLDVKDMLKTEGGFPETQAAWYMTIYLYVFIFIGVNIGLQLFVGIVVNNFNEHKPDHSALLTVSQKRWTDLMQRISLTRPIKLPPEPVDNCFRQNLYKVVVSKAYRHISTFIIVLNSLTLATPWVDTPDELRKSTMISMSFSIIYSFYFIVELCVKMLAFGPLKGYFHSWRNALDFLLSLLYIGYIICALLYLIDDDSIQLRVVADYALVLAVVKCFTIMGRYSIFQNLMITVGQTMFKSLPLILVYTVTVLTYALVGVVLFGQVRPGTGINYGLVNFDGSYSAINLILRVTTGEDWHHILHDTMVGEPYCSEVEGNCGNPAAAVIWFISYYVLVTFIFINIFIAVLLENFSIFYNEDDTELSHTVVKDFRHNWYYFDETASGSIPTSRLKLFLRMLRLQKLFSFQTSENGVKERRQGSPLSDPLLLREMADELTRDPRQGTRGETQGHEETEGKKEGKHSFQSVLKMLAYRAEDITKRLEPQELYVRDELEENVQFDVAEECILKWIQKFVKPVIAKQKQRRQTIVGRPTRAARREETVMMRMNLVEDPTNWRQETEEESEPSTFPRSKGRVASPSLQYSASEEHVDAPTVEGGHENPALAKSYAKLESVPVLHVRLTGTGMEVRDEWHDWFKMQREWMDNVEHDPENYFDDCL